MDVQKLAEISEKETSEAQDKYVYILRVQRELMV